MGWVLKYNSRRLPVRCRERAAGGALAAGRVGKLLDFPSIEIQILLPLTLLDCFKAGG